MEVIKIGNVYGNFSGGNYAGNVYLASGLSPALLNIGSGGGRMPMVMVWK